jgi:hypothetical protein
MRSRRLHWHGLALGLGAIASGTWGFTNTGCILSDKCIVVLVQGNDWCSEIINAQMWPGGHPELAVVVKTDDNKWPSGCACFNFAEEEILAAELPPAKYAAFRAQIAAVARDDCDFYVPVGWDHNCYDEGPDGPVVGAPAGGNPGECVGDCAYTNEPKDGCGEDPTPYECEVLYGDGGETGGAMTDADDSTTGAAFDMPGEIQWTR